MAIKRFETDGYGQIELNQVAFPRDGRVVTQCHADETDFASVALENGMLLQVDERNKVVKLPSANSALPVAVVYSSERIYDERNPGLKEFKNDDFLPRLGYLSVGDKWTTNAFCYDEALVGEDGETIEEVIAKTLLYAVPHVSGVVQLVATAPVSGPYLEVVKPFTMPDGQYAIQLRVLIA